MVEVVALILALVIVPLTGGSFRRLSKLEFEAPGLLFTGLAIQVVVELTPVIPESRADDLGFALLLASYVLILSFGLLNLRITGMSIVTIGIALNVLVIALNQGMPYRAPEETKSETTVKHRPERKGDLLAVLDDRIIVRGPISESVSFGDLILAVGIVNVGYRGSRRVRRSARAALDRPDVMHTAPTAVTTMAGNGAAAGHIDLVSAEAPDPVRSGTRS